MKKWLLGGAAAVALLGMGAGAYIFLAGSGGIAVVRHSVDAIKGKPSGGMAIDWTSEEETKTALVLHGVSVSLDSGSAIEADRVEVEPHAATASVRAGNISVTSPDRSGAAQIRHAAVDGVSIARLPGLLASLTAAGAVRALDGSRLAADGIRLQSSDPGAKPLNASVMSFSANLAGARLGSIHAENIGIDSSGLTATPFMPPVSRSVRIASFKQDGLDLGGLLSDSLQERQAAARDGFGVGRVEISGVTVDNGVVETLTYARRGPGAFHPATGAVTAREKALFGDAGLEVRQIAVRGRPGVAGVDIDVPKLLRLELRGMGNFDPAQPERMQVNRLDVRIDDLGIVDAAVRVGSMGDRSEAARRAGSLASLQMARGAVNDTAGTVGRLQDFISGSVHDFEFGLLIERPRPGLPIRTFTLVQPQATRVE